jgi:hypothetical protein
MSTATQQTIAAEIRALPVKEKLHLAAGFLGSPWPHLVRMAESIVRLALQEIEAERKAKEAQPS